MRKVLMKLSSISYIIAKYSSWLFMQEITMPIPLNVHLDKKRIFWSLIFGNFR